MTQSKLKPGPADSPIDIQGKKPVPDKKGPRAEPGIELPMKKDSGKSKESRNDQ